MIPIESTVVIPRLDSKVTRSVVDNCNFCASSENRPFCPQNGRQLVQCQNCGLVYVGHQPRAEELATLYNEHYFRNDQSGEVGYTNYAADEANIRQTASKRLAHVMRYAQTGKLLDVGCALGFFMDVAHQRGWQVTGWDISQYAVDYVRQRFGHEAFQGNFLDNHLANEAYDALTLYDVIEHVADPKGYLQTAARLLKRGGVIELATPDVGSIPARLTGKRWIGYKMADEHVYYFSADTLSKMLNEAGFEVLHVRHVGKHVTLKLFLDRLGFYVPWLARPLQLLEHAFKLSQRSFYVNPMDIVAITARKR